MQVVRAEAVSAPTTPLVRLPLPTCWHVDIYFKDESQHATGSLKHRLARSLFIHALCSGNLAEGMTVIDASSGSTAISEAYFAGLLGMTFIAVLPRSTTPEKIALVESAGGKCYFVDHARDVRPCASSLAEQCGGYFLDQFGRAESVSDWRQGSVAAEVIEQFAKMGLPIPEWFVVGAGTGGTSATIGRHLRYRGLKSLLAVVDPERSAYLDDWAGAAMRGPSASSRIEGIGRPTVEPSFVKDVIDVMYRVPDAASIASMRLLSSMLGRRVGPSSGTNLWGALQLASRMQADGRSGTVVSLICDDGERYASTYYNPRWLIDNGLLNGDYEAIVNEVVASAVWRE